MTPSRPCGRVAPNTNDITKQSCYATAWTKRHKRGYNCEASGDILCKIIPRPKVSVTFRDDARKSQKDLPGFLICVEKDISEKNGVGPARLWTSHGM